MTLQHSGVKGMRWGDRRYQNLDGSLTPAGRLRYLGSNRSLLKSGSGSSSVSSGGNMSLLKSGSGSSSSTSNNNGYLSVVKNGGNSTASNSGGLQSVIKRVTTMPDNFSVTKLSSPENKKRSKVGHNAVHSMGLI